MRSKRVMWFSAGVSSAVALHLAMKDGPVDHVIYIHIDDQHEDTIRFVEDVGRWTGADVCIMQSPLKNVENACLAAGGRGYINGPGGAACTLRLKKRVRKEWEREQKCRLTYIWGLDLEEKSRADRLLEAMPEFDHEFPLIDHQLTKQDAHGILARAGIKRPVMYDLGYPNNNCIGCVKGGMGYWNKIRVDFPDVFKARLAMEERIGASCTKTPLRDLDPEAGRMSKPIVEDCGIMCELATRC